MSGRLDYVHTALFALNGARIRCAIIGTTAPDGGQSFASLCGREVSGWAYVPNSYAGLSLRNEHALITCELCGCSVAPYDADVNAPEPVHSAGEPAPGSD